MVRCSQWCEYEHEVRGSKKINHEAEADWLVRKSHVFGKKVLFSRSIVGHLLFLLTINIQRSGTCPHDL